MQKIEVEKISKAKLLERLREIPDCPEKIYLRGNKDILNSNYLVSIVGSRKATDYGLKHSRKIARELAQSGVVIVSGLALGIDTEAHKGALEAGGKTIAVLGTAIDKIYPATNLSLAKNILESGSVIISEYQEGSPTYRSNFALRNRIIAGISMATIVIEAAEKSGALITAFLTLDYNRELYALPGNIDRINSKGTNRLIRSGANCLIDAVNLLSDFNIIEPKRKVASLSIEEKQLADIFIESEFTFDQILSKLSIDPAKLNVLLAMLELKGILVRSANGYYGLS